MPHIHYYVATSLDGYISGPGGDISLFAQEGPGVDRYLSDLQSYQTVIMGRHTYEFGYAFGLTPGQPAYPHMEHHIFSRSLRFDDAHPQVHVHELDADRIRSIRDHSPTDVYLCGGGTFTGWLLEENLIDRLILKINPIILGDGIRLFGHSQTQAVWEPMETVSYPEGIQLVTMRRG